MPRFARPPAPLTIPCCCFPTRPRAANSLCFWGEREQNPFPGCACMTRGAHLARAWGDGFLPGDVCGVCPQTPAKAPGEKWPAVSLGLCEGGDARARLCSCSKGGSSCHPCIGAVKKGICRSCAASLACPTQGRARSLDAFCWGALKQHPEVTPFPPRAQEPPRRHHRSPGATPAPGDTALLPGLSQSYPFLELPLLTDQCGRRWGHLGTWRVPAWLLAVLTNCSEALSQRALLRLVTVAASLGVSLQARFEPCPEARGRLRSASQDVGRAEGSAPHLQPGGLIGDVLGAQNLPTGDVLGARSLPVRSGVQLPAFCFGGSAEPSPRHLPFGGGPSARGCRCAEQSCF